MRYKFVGCRVWMDANAILKDLKDLGVVGVALMPYLGIVEVDFSEEPTTDVLNQVKDYLMARAYEKVEEEPIPI